MISNSHIHIGDAFSVLQTMPDESVNQIITSPPYFHLRDYEIEGQIGMEVSVDLYLDRLRDVFAEAWRVLRRDGVMFLNIADSYNGSNKGRVTKRGLRSTAASGTNAATKEAGYKPKDLLFIPARLAMVLQADGWYVRNSIIWHKPDPVPESMQDRFTRSYEFVYMLTKSRRYYFDRIAVRELASVNSHGGGRDTPDRKVTHQGGGNEGLLNAQVTEYRNKRDVWTIAVEGYAGAHYAVMPLELALTCIKAGCPQTVCAICGAPHVRIVERGKRLKTSRAHRGELGADSTLNGLVDGATGDRYANGRTRAKHKAEHPDIVKGFAPSCNCEPVTTRPGCVLDPFGGVGTTGLAAISHGVDYQLIELNPKFAEMARTRLASYDPAQDKPLKEGGVQLSLLALLDNLEGG